MLPTLTVYFACPHCGMIYQAKQVRFIERTNGRYDCIACRKPVHTWSGFYDFMYWKPMDQQAYPATGRTRL